MLSELRDWLVDWADSPAGPAALGLLSAAESVFFPLPPDPLLIALALRNPDQALYLAALTTAASVLGGIVGHWLGLRFGLPLMGRLHSRHADRASELLRKHGFWAIALAGLTPLPYKVFTIAAGVANVPRTQFILASIVGRGARFFLFGALIFFWGDRFETFFEEQFDVLLLVGMAMFAVALALWLLWMQLARRRRVATAAANAAGRPPDPPDSYDDDSGSAPGALLEARPLGEGDPPDGGR